MKFNFGHGIVVGYVLFVGYILYFVFTSFTHKIDLVADDYYAQEVAFQTRINETQNAQEWTDAISATKTEAGLEINFGPEALKDFSSGKAYFFRPSDSDFDLTIPLTLNAEGSLTIPYQLLHDGRYELQLIWESEAKKYFTKKDIFI
jgi:nitrogen fixation protein FixH